MQLGLIIIGVDHFTAPARLVERMRERDGHFHRALVQLSASDDVSEIFHGKLPNHTIVLVSSFNPVKAANLVLDALTRTVQLRRDDWTAFYRHLDEAAVAFLLAMAEGADGEQTAIQLKSSWEQSQKAGVGGRILGQLTQAIVDHARASRQNRTTAESLRAASRQVWSRLQSEVSLPASALVRFQLETICAEEIAAFRRNSGGLMTADQERAVKIVTARIKDRIGKWMTSAWNDPATGTLNRSAVSLDQGGAEAFEPVKEKY